MSGTPPAEVVLLAPGGVEVVRWPLAGDAPVGLAMVEELARVALAARRSGWSVQICGLGAELGTLLELTGLAEAVGCPRP